MKHTAAAAVALLLVLLCACAKPAPEEPPAAPAPEEVQTPVSEEPAPEAPERDTAPSGQTAPVAFEAVEELPSLSELQGGEAPAGKPLLLRSQQYGPITATYYALAPELDIWGARRELVGVSEENKTPTMELPDDLGLTPFRTVSNPSATRLLICELDADAPSPTYRYFLYDGEEVCAVTALNDRPFGVVHPPHVRWRGDDALAFDVENPETGKFTTYVYDILTEEEQVLLADYALFPFDAGDTARERYLLVDDTYVLRVERGGAICLRRLDAAEEMEIPDLQTPDTSYFHITRLNPRTVVYFAADENSRFPTLAFIDCESGSCAKLNRSVSDEINEQFFILWDDSSIAIPASCGMADDTQNLVLVYSFEKSALPISG